MPNWRGGTNPPRSRRSSDFYPSLLVGQERTGTILFSKCIYFLRKSLLKNLFIGYDPVPVAEMAQEIVHVLEGGNSIYTHRRTL